jgi:hypothetical protein
MFFTLMVVSPGSPSALPGVYRRCFLALMVGVVDIFSVDGGRSRIYSSGTSLGAHHQRSANRW